MSNNWSFKSCDDTSESVRTNHPYSLFTCKLLSEMAAEPNDRTQFIKSAIEYAKKYGFDGIDIDWEYLDDSKRGGQNADSDNYLKLLKEFRQTAGKDFIVTMAAAAIPKDSKQNKRQIHPVAAGVRPIFRGKKISDGFGGNSVVRSLRVAPLGQSSPIIIYAQANIERSSPLVQVMINEIFALLFVSFN